MRKLISALIAVWMAVSVVPCFPVVPAAAETLTTSEYSKILVEENFDEYQKGNGFNKTKLTKYFIADACAIGDSVIDIMEDSDSNLYLRSRIFT